MSMPASPMSTEHPDGTKALVISILSLLCCAPLALWSLYIANNARGQGTADSKINAAFGISIAALILWAGAVIMRLIGVL